MGSAAPWVETQVDSGGRFPLPRKFEVEGTEVLISPSIPTGPVRVGDALVSPVTAALDLGVYIDAGVTMRTQVINTARACFAALRQCARSVACDGLSLSTPC